MKKCSICGKDFEFDFPQQTICNECEKLEKEKSRLAKCKIAMKKRIGERYANADFSKIKIDTIPGEYREQYEKAIKALHFLPSNYIEGKKRTNCITTLTGSNGTGKTFLAACLMWECYLRSIRFMYVNAKPFLDNIKKFSYSPEWDERQKVKDDIQRAKTLPILILDEFHMITGSKEDVGILHDIINTRDSKLLETVLIGNIQDTDESFLSFFGAELCDRIRRKNNAIFNFFGQSMRKI